MASAEKQLGAANVEACLRLRHVGCGDVARLQTLVGLTQLFSQHFEVRPLQFQDAGVTQQIHVGGGGVEQHGLLDVAQRFARGKHLALREPRAVGGLKAVQQVLCDRGADAMRSVDAALGEIAGWEVQRRRRADLTDRGRQRLHADIGRRHSPGPVTGERRRHAFIGGANHRALRVERRVVGVGVSKGGFERVGQGGLAQQQRRAEQHRTRDRHDRMVPPTHGFQHSASRSALNISVLTLEGDADPAPRL